MLISYCKLKRYDRFVCAGLEIRLFSFVYTFDLIRSNRLIRGAFSVPPSVTIGVNSGFGHIVARRAGP
jgi:hypothetical protein